MGASAEIQGAWPGRGLVAFVLALIASVSPVHVAGMPAAPFANSRVVAADGVSLHLREWPAQRSAAARCPVLLVHALAGSTHSFRHLVPVLVEAGHRVLAVDLPGYGYSERRPFEGSASGALWALLAAEAPGQAWCLAGHSMGARVVGQMVADEPARVAAVAYFSGSPVRARRRGPAMFKAQPLRGMVLALAERRYLRSEGLAKALEEGYGQAPDAADVEAYLRPLRLPGTLTAILDGYATDMGPDRTGPEALAAVPSLVVWGGRDRWLKPEVGRELANALPAAGWVLIDAAGHSPMETHPAAVLPPLLDLFAGSAEAGAAQGARLGTFSRAVPVTSTP